MRVCGSWGKPNQLFLSAADGSMNYFSWILVIPIGSFWVVETALHFRNAIGRPKQEAQCYRTANDRCSAMCVRESVSQSVSHSDPFSGVLLGANRQRSRVIIMTVLYCFDAMEARTHARTTRVDGRSSGFIGVYHGRVRYANCAFQNSYTYVTVLSVICEFFFLIKVFSCCFGSRFCDARPCVRTCVRTLL